MVDRDYINLICSLLSCGEKVQMEFKGSSMQPTIPSPCKILVSKPGEITIGGIYVYITPEPYSSLVCHRLIVQSEEKLFFQGDNRKNIDQFVTRESIIGRCIAYIINDRVFSLEEG